MSSSHGAHSWAADRGLSPYRDGNADDRAAWLKLCNLQRRILPQVPPTIRGYRLALSYRPAFVITGDYHDFFHRLDGSTAVFVGDGSGHGPATAMLMAMMRTILQTHPQLHRDPGETLTVAGQMFRKLIPADLFMTGLYVSLGHDGRVAWAAAGHHPPLHASRAGEVRDTDLSPIGPVLGFDWPEEYPTIHWQLAPGERLLLFTDGLWEARSRDGEAFGRPRLRHHLTETADRPLDWAVGELVAKAAKHTDGAEFEDDFTIIGIERLD